MVDLQTLQHLISLFCYANSHGDGLMAILFGRKEHVNLFNRDFVVHQINIDMMYS